VPVPGDAHFRERYDFDARFGSVLHKMPDATQVVAFVARLVPELDGSNANVTHSHI
jgi:hypothetical protein